MIKDYREFVKQVNECLRYNGWTYSVGLEGEYIVEVGSKNRFSFYFLDCCFGGGDIVRETAFLVVGSINSGNKACTNCIDCISCYNCVDCVGCLDCVGCVGCNSCERCTDCVDFVGCLGG